MRNKQINYEIRKDDKNRCKQFEKKPIKLDICQSTSRDWKQKNLSRHDLKKSSLIAANQLWWLIIDY